MVVQSTSHGRGVCGLLDGSCVPRGPKLDTDLPEKSAQNRRDRVLFKEGIQWSWPDTGVLAVKRP